jgi:hypothetical protein
MVPVTVALRPVLIWHAHRRVEQDIPPFDVVNRFVPHEMHGRDVMLVLVDDPEETADSHAIETSSLRRFACGPGLRWRERTDDLRTSVVIE